MWGFLHTSRVFSVVPGPKTRMLSECTALYFDYTCCMEITLTLMPPVFARCALEQNMWVTTNLHYNRDGFYVRMNASTPHETAITGDYCC